jgi:prophage regulatory protein
MLQRFLRRPEVEKATGLKKSAIYEAMANERFPRPKKLPGLNVVVWLESDIAAWQKRMLGEAA